MLCVSKASFAMADDVLKDWKKTTKTLFADVCRAAEEVDRCGDGYTRRNYVRSVFAAIEGITHGMKRVTLQVWKLRQSRLDSDELGKLMEVKFDSQGRSRKRFLPFGDNIKFTFEAFAKVHGVAESVNYTGKGWAALLSAAEIRHRLMHPKSADDLEISDAEMVSVRTAAAWYFPVRNQLVIRAAN